MFLTSICYGKDDGDNGGDGYVEKRRRREVEHKKEQEEGKEKERGRSRAEEAY